MTAHIPIPPSVNALYFNAPGRGRVKTDKYRAWLEETVPILKRAWPISIAGFGWAGPARIIIVIQGGVGFPVSRDLDNCEKAVLDALQAANVIVSDDVRTVKEITIRYIDRKANRAAKAWCSVTIEEPVAQ